MRQEEKDTLMRSLVVDAFVDLMLIGELEVTELTIDNFLKDRYFLDRYLKVKKSFEEEIAKSVKAVEIPKVQLSENVYVSKPINKSDINSILKNARANNDTMKNSSWSDPQGAIESKIIKEAKAEGKSEYDSDVLRELILHRQKTKNKKINVKASLEKIDKTKK